MNIISPVSLVTLFVFMFPSAKAVCPRASGLPTARTKIEYPGLTFTPSTGKLEVAQLSNETLAGKFTSNTDVIINFKSTSHGLLHFWDTNGSTIYKVENTPENYLIQIGEHRFVSRANTPANNKQGNTNKLNNDRSQQDADEMKLSRAFKELLDDPVARLLGKVSRALGDAGVFGHTSPSSLPLHATTLFISRRLSIDDLGEIDRDCEPQQENRGRSRRQDSCSLENDPNHDNCLGMCGRLCSCWRVVCGDCCYHQGCYEHDLCCKYKFFSASCLVKPVVNFSCSSYGDYPKCLDN